MHIVTGGAGFIGSAFVSKLNSLGNEDIIIVDSLGSGEKWKNLRGKFFIDLLQPDEFLKLISESKSLRQAKLIMHLGACSSTTEKDCDFLYQNNFRFSAQLAEFALVNKVRFVYASSGATFGDGTLGFGDEDETSMKLQPLNAYGFSKQLFDTWLIKRGYQKKVVGLKYFNVFGPNEYHKGEMRSVVVKSYEQIKANGVVRLFKSYKEGCADGEQSRDFIYIKDCLDVMMWFANRPQTNGIFNLGTGLARTWNDLVLAIYKALGLPAKIEYIEMPDYLKGQYQYFSQAAMGKLRSAGYVTGFSTLEDAVKDYVNNYLDNGMAYL